MTDVDNETAREVELNIVIAYPETKKKKSTYRNVTIARVGQAALPTTLEFKTRMQKTPLFPQSDAPPTTIFPPIEKKPPEQPEAKLDTGPDATFLTGIESHYASTQSLVTRADKFPHVKDQRHAENEMPSYFLARSLAPTTEVRFDDRWRATERRQIQQNKLKTAMTSLRYQLHHPLTSHNDIDFAADVNASRPTAIHTMRQRPRRHDGSFDHPKANGGTFSLVETTPYCHFGLVIATIDRAIDDVNAKLHQRDMARHGVNLNNLLRKANRLVQHK
ncbi:Aste57867_16360 [Aphanomyces stellatus]|uniref:Aste57867_16360 protein n=1 Tax=Aphanomyces stellatus TaxID=120398 RepID=A0A485L8G7_9STRA|nr:hypothetical protein As57867_016303 [Aphanomyces stellatus]VFT93136.1 Aste57867_16360 [Aphanomyces stellatus]